MKKLIDEIIEMIESNDSTLNLNDVVNDINKNRNLGSSNQCYKVMYKVAQYFNVKKMLEIGTHKAASTIIYCQAILDNNQIPEIHSVDDWSQLNVEDIAKSNIEKAGFENYIKMYNGDSIIKVPEVFNEIGKVDLVFIDGNHKFDYVIADFNNCKEYSDIILFHDTSEGKNLPYLEYAKDCGFEIYSFFTKYIEGDGHLVGITLAIKSKK